MQGSTFEAEQRIRNVLRHVVRDPRLAALATVKLASRGIDPWFQTRTEAYVEGAIPVGEAVRSAFGATVGARITRHMGESVLEQIEREMASRVDASGGPTMGGAAYTRLYYAIVRELRPSVVVETGVASGFSSGVILAALAENDHGHLWSVDVAPLSQDTDSLVGVAVPARLVDRWTLLRGPDRRELRRLLPGLGEIDLGFYDSDKTYVGMSRTLRVLWSYLGPRGVLVVDDIQTQDAYMRFCGERQIPIVACRKPDRDGEGGAFYVGVAPRWTDRAPTDDL